jgi:hypothetical protein
MKKISLVTIVALAVILIAAAVPAVSATYEQTLTDQKIISKDYTFPNSYYQTSVSSGDYRMSFANIEDWPDVKVVYVRNDVKSFSNLELAKSQDSRPQYVDFIVSDTSENIGNGYLTYNIFYNDNNVPVSVQFWVEINEWNIDGLSGRKTILLQLNPDSPLKQFNVVYSQYDGISTKDKPVTFGGFRVVDAGMAGYYIINSEFNWVNTITINDDRLILIRDGYYSKLTIQTGENIFQEASYDDRNIFISPPITWTVTNAMGTNFTGSYEGESSPDDPGHDPGDTADVTVYIKNSQTGALIADANVVIDALVDGEYYPVTNRTEPSGIFTINLQPTGGGKPNPDGYRLIVTADGYNNPMPEINFTVDDYKQSIYCLLDPIAGGPVNENKTFIDFFVRDMTSNPISGATVKFGKYTLITNSAGYTVFEVDKNNNYSWTISKSGYGPLTGNAVIGNDPRHTINTVLAPIVTPTITTPIPTSPPIDPTPTMTAPTGEHVSNWLEWFAAHFGMILGGGVEIGKIFMWLCFTVPVGVYVGKEAKAGAAGFMAGAGIVTLFFVLIGWVPIWLVVLLALIIGLLYAKVFNAQDNGGGR